MQLLFVTIPGVRRTLFYLLAPLLLILTGCTQKVSEYVTPAEPTIDRVSITDGPWYDAMIRTKEYLHYLDVERLLFHFRKVAGIPTDAEEYGGWEMEWRELRGHSIGHYLSAVSRMFVLTGDTALYRKGEYVVQELRKCQLQIGTGYVSAFPDEYLDRVENIESVWAPYYTLHKILAGLFDFHMYSDNAVALEIALDLVHYLHDRIKPLGKEHFQKVLDNTEQGGMNEVFWNIYAETGDTISRILAQTFYQHSYFDPLAERKDHLKGYHSNSFIPNVVGVAREYEITGDITKKQISKFFWNQVVGARSFVTGGTSNSEHWNADPHHMHTETGAAAHESCCTYNMIRLTDYLWKWSGDHKYHDYMERALTNGILPTQNKETGMSMYYVSMDQGFYKTWGTPDSSFWCCTGTGMENFSRIAEYIYGRLDDRLYVNQFAPSTFKDQENGFTLTQYTTLPIGDHVGIEIKSDASVPLKLAVRIPSWSGSDYQVAINGEMLTTKPSAGSYLLIDREWEDGDMLDITFTSQLWYSLLPVTNNYVAFGYGPVILAARFHKAEVGADLRHRYGPYDGEPVEVPAVRFNPNKFEDYIEIVDINKRHFKILTQSGNTIDLVPFYDIHMEHFSIYLPVGGP
jgi:uncharacterized protein